MFTYRAHSSKTVRDYIENIIDLAFCQVYADGWSLNDAADLEKLFNRIKQVIVK